MIHLTLENIIIVYLAVGMLSVILVFIPKQNRVVFDQRVQEILKSHSFVGKTIILVLAIAFLVICWLPDLFYFMYSKYTRK